MPDYNKGKIYVIRNHVNDKVYIGSTTQYLYKRFGDHKKHLNSKQRENIKLYVEMRNIGKDKFYIELIENYPCNNIEELNAREGYYQKQYNSHKDNYGYNKLVAGRDEKTYRQDEKENISLKRKEQYIKNKEHIKNRVLNNYNKNKDIINGKKREEYNKNKTKISNQNKQWRDNNRTKVKCECGSEIFKYKMGDHIKTKKHQEYLENQPIIYIKI